MFTKIGLTGIKYYSQYRTERLIALGRAGLAGFFLLAIWLDPSEPFVYARLTYGILTGYFIYALLLVILLWKISFNQGFSLIVMQVTDLLVFVVVMFLTKGPNSPFFVYFVFSLICAALRWQWRGVFWTAVAALTSVIAMAWFSSNLINEPDFEINRFIIRVVYLAVVAVMLGYMGAYKEKLHRELSSLAAWPRVLSVEFHYMLQEILKHVTGILDVSRLLMAWEEGDEPWLHLAYFSNGELQYTREAPGTFGNLVAETLEGSSFFCQETYISRPAVVLKVSAGLQKWNGIPLHESLSERFCINSILAMPIKGDTLKGYLFAIDKIGMTSDSLVLGEIVARELSIRMEYIFALKELKKTMAVEERMHVARDLHDGVLQTLTGVALQIETVQRLIEIDPETARLRLQEVQRIIANEQRELRSNIEELRPDGSGGQVEYYELAARLDGLAERIRQQWGLSVDISIMPPYPRIAWKIGREVYFVVHESMINAVRHSGASALKVQLTFESDRVCIIVTDNGKGFPFQGHFDHFDLYEMKRGPVILKERIADLRGTLSIYSVETGARLDITLPLAGSGY